MGKKLICGSAGLFSAAPDLLNFLEMLLNGGVFKGRKYFSEAILKLMRTNQISSIGEFAGLGWELHQPRYMGKYSTEHTFGKTGFTGCLVICDMEKGVAAAMLSNAVHPQRKPDPKVINEVRRDVMDIIFEELT